MRALTLHQPWASLVALGIKTVETRSWSTSYRGPLAIHAGAERPDHASVGEWHVGKEHRPHHPRGHVMWRSTTKPGDLFGTEQVVSLPLGAVVATCTLVDVVPMVVVLPAADRPRGTRPYPDHDHLTLFPVHAPGSLILMRGGNGVHVDDQRPYGDFAPGRYAWLLDDIAPTTERCPACWGGGEEWELVRSCPVCDGAGRCDPIPAKGRQRLWEWTL